jgi:hypothetical protein
VAIFILGHAASSFRPFGRFIKLKYRAGTLVRHKEVFMAAGAVPARARNRT